MEPEPTTQTCHPWRAMTRTAFQAIVGLAAMWGLIVEVAGVDATIPWVASSVAATAGIARVMALPQVEDWLASFIPWLAADPERYDQ